ncbi:MAG TPA: protein tyrosine phosphatase family protein [Thermoanaerobaculia bacterium]|nr:protein tyrosine phosphatase family protein [Thermoanaerobaculia bacterium]
MKTKLALLLLALLVPAVFVAAHGAADIEKFNAVSDKVATGGQPTPAQMLDLSREGYKTVICLREPGEFDAKAEEAAAKSKGLTWINIPVNRESPKPEQVDAFLAALSSPKVYPVFIHCGTGSRVAAFWMVRRVLVDKWDLEDAQREAKLVGLKSETMKEFALNYIQTHQK